MEHLTNIYDIEEVINQNKLCLFFVKSPDCGVCNVMLAKVSRLTERFSQFPSFFADITEEPLIAGRFLVYSGPTVLLLQEGKEIYRGSRFINLEELEHKLEQYSDHNKKPC